MACGAPGVAGLRSLLVKAGEEEGDDVVLVRGSPERWQLKLDVRAEEGERELETGGRR
jgi:hypothetical protein